MPRHTGHNFIPWARCDVCDSQWPLTNLTKQKGVFRCPKCMDDLSLEARQKQIADVLKTGEERVDQRVERVATDDWEVIF